LDSEGAAMNDETKQRADEKYSRTVRYKCRKESVYKKDEEKWQIDIERPRMDSALNSRE